MTHVITRTAAATPTVAGPDIWRYKWTITGGQIGTGFMTFYADGSLPATPFANATATLISAAWGAGVSGGIPAGVTLVPDGAVDMVNIATGALEGFSGITPPATISGANSQAYAAPSGFCLTWLTGGVVAGRHVHGRSFFVPISSTKMDTNGTLLDGYVTSIRAAAAVYTAGAWNPVVWHRPKGGTGGSAHVMNGYTLNDKVAMLTSRR